MHPVSFILTKWATIYESKWKPWFIEAFHTFATNFAVLHISIYMVRVWNITQPEGTRDYRSTKSRKRNTLSANIIGWLNLEGTGSLYRATEGMTEEWKEETRFPTSSFLCPWNSTERFISIPPTNPCPRLFHSEKSGKKIFHQWPI